MIDVNKGLKLSFVFIIVDQSCNILLSVFNLAITNNFIAQQ